MKNPTASCALPYFDSSLDAWVLTRHADVLAAFHSSALDVVNPDQDTAVGHEMRVETLAALSPAQVRRWSAQMAAVASANANQLSAGKSVDLLNFYVRPVCLYLATLVTGLPPDLAESVRDLSMPISMAAAEPLDAALQAEAETVSALLRPYFSSSVEMLRDSGFVALAHTLPGLAASALNALLCAPRQWSLLHQHPALLESGVEELMRYAGLTRTTRRLVRNDTVCNGVALHRGDKLELCIMSANHDAERFPAPNELDLRRRDCGHFTLGAGAHACVAASLIRAATVELVRPLVATFGGAEITQGVEWQGGSGFQHPRSLHVLLAPASEHAGRQQGQHGDANNGDREPQAPEAIPGRDGL